MAEPRSDKGWLERVTVQFVRGRGFARSMLALFLVALLAVLVRSWQTVRPLVMRDPRYQIELDDIEITPPPHWIRSDAQVLKQQAAEFNHWKFPMWLREPRLTWELARGFRRHPWVREVKRAKKSFPATVRVDLVYRKPVAMVEVPVVDGAAGWLPIDGDGFCLSTDDFQHQDRALYLEVRIPSVKPRSETGPWGDVRVHGAARIAELLAPYREVLSIRSIVGPPYDPTVADPLANFTLVFNDGRTQGWGHPPGSESPGEPPAAEKVRVLLRARGIHPEDAGHAMLMGPHWSIPDPQAGGIPRGVPQGRAEPSRTATRPRGAASPLPR